MFIYPDNLKAKATFALWEIKNIVIIGVCALFSVLVLTQTGTLAPLAITGVYGFLTIQYEGISILSFIKNAVSFFISRQQVFEWKI